MKSKTSLTLTAFLSAICVLSLCAFGWQSTPPLDKTLADSTARQFYEKEKDLCLPARAWPVRVEAEPASEGPNEALLGEMRGLEAAGLVSSETHTEDRAVGADKYVHSYFLYSLTAKADKYTKTLKLQQPDAKGQPQPLKALCYGHLSYAGVVQITLSAREETSGYDYSDVRFAEQLTDKFEPWVFGAVEDANKDVAYNVEMLETRGKLTHTLRMRYESSGWKPR